MTTPTATIASEIQEIAKTLNDGCHNPGNCWSKACQRNHQCSTSLSALAEKVERLEAENERLRENAAPRCDQCSCLIDGGSVTLCKTCRAAPPEVVLRDALDVLNDTMQVCSIEYYRIFKLIADASKVSKSIEGFLEMKSEFDPFSATLLAGEGGNIHQQPKGDANGG